MFLQPKGKWTSDKETVCKSSCNLNILFVRKGDLLMLWDLNLGRQTTRFRTETQKKNTKCRWRESGCVLSRRESCSSGSFGHLRPPSIGPDLTCWRSVRLNSLAVRSTLWAFWSFCCIPVFVGSLSWWGGHWLQSAVAVRGCTRSATVSRWVVWFKWHPHARHDQQRASVPGEDCTLWTVQQVTLHTLWVQHWANTVTKSESSSLWLVFVL